MRLFIDLAVMACLAFGPASAQVLSDSPSSSSVPALQSVDNVECSEIIFTAYLTHQTWYDSYSFIIYAGDTSESSTASLHTLYPTLANAKCM